MARLLGVEQDLGLLRLDEPSGRSPSLGGTTSAGSLSRALISAGQLFSNVASQGAQSDRREGRFLKSAREALAKARTSTETKILKADISNQAFEKFGAERGAFIVNQVKDLDAPTFDVDDRGKITMETFAGERREIGQFKTTNQHRRNLQKQSLALDAWAPNAAKATDALTAKINATRARTGQPLFGQGREMGPLLDIQSAATNAFQSTWQIVTNIQEAAALSADLGQDLNADEFKARATRQILQNYYAAMNAFFDDDLITALRDVGDDINENDIAMVAAAFASDFNSLLQQTNAYNVLDIDPTEFTKIRDQFIASYKQMYDGVKTAEQRDAKFKINFAAANLAYTQHLTEYKLAVANNQFELDAEVARLNSIFAINQAIGNFGSIIETEEFKHAERGTPLAARKNVIQGAIDRMHKQLGSLAGVGPSIRQIKLHSKLDLSKISPKPVDIIREGERILVSHLETIFAMGDRTAVIAAAPDLIRMFNNFTGQMTSALEIIQARGNDEAGQFAENKAKAIQSKQLEFQKFIAQIAPNLEDNINEIDTSVFEWITATATGAFGIMDLPPQFRGF